MPMTVECEVNTSPEIDNWQYGQLLKSVWYKISIKLNAISITRTLTQIKTDIYKPHYLCFQWHINTLEWASVEHFSNGRGDRRGIKKIKNEINVNET